MPVCKEYRIPLPISVEEYQVGQLYSVAEASKDNTGGGEGVEVVKNEPYQNAESKGQYTFKIFRMESKVPKMIRKLFPKGSLNFHEHAWNAYPHCKTVVSNPDYMKEKMECKIESWHKKDLGTLDNVHGLPKDQLKNREVIHIDIVNDPVKRADYLKEADPKLFKNEKDASRSALKPTWLEELRIQVKQRESELASGKNEADLPPLKYMCAYKLVTVKFVWFGLQGMVEKFSIGQQRRIFTLFHRQLYCWLDRWVEMTMEDIRKLEDKTKADLAKNIDQGEKRGHGDGGDDE